MNEFKLLSQVKTTVDHTGEVYAALKHLAGREVFVGIPEENASRKDEGINSAELAYIHNNGARRKAMREEMQPKLDSGTAYPLALQAYLEERGSPLWKTPPRPFLEPVIEKHRDEIAEDMGKALKKALEGDLEGSEKALARAGSYAASKVKNYFREDNDWPELSPKTIKARAKKGKSVDFVRPLIDTGAMRQAITYTVKGKGQ